MSEKPDKTRSLEEASPVATTARPKIVADEKVITGCYGQFCHGCSHQGHPAQIA